MIVVFFRFIGTLLLLFIVLINGGDCFAQSKAELEKQKKQLTQEIEYSNQILKKTQNQKDVSLKELNVLNSQITAREKIIGTINAQLRVINNEIRDKQKEITASEKQLVALRESYAAMVRFAYRNRSAYDKLMFIFAAEDFNQAYKRLKYLQQISLYRKRQASYIEQTRIELGHQMNALNERKAEKNALLGEEMKERSSLNEEKAKQARVVASLKNKEAALRAEIIKKQRESQKINAAIQAAIKRELDAANKKNATAAKSPSSSAVAKSTVTPEVAKLTADFTGNKGKLPWPVMKGVIVERFGTHPHPVLPKIEVSNDGITIKTEASIPARCVFEGEVIAVSNIYGEYAVIIKHGEYFTVYSNLKSVSVKKGDKLTLKQPVGTVRTDRDGNTELNFQVWKGQSKLDPEPWLAR